MPRGDGEASPPHSRGRRRAVGEDLVKRGVRGYDGAKQVKGRKRHIIVDVNGLLLAVLVLAADSLDVEALSQMLAKKNPALADLQLIWVDSGYKPYEVHQAILKEHGVKVEVKKVKESRSESTNTPGFRVIPRRWVVERTFSWLSNFRLLSKEYELLLDTSEADIHIAMSCLMLRRLAPSQTATGWQKTA